MKSFPVLPSSGIDCPALLAFYAIPSSITPLLLFSGLPTNPTYREPVVWASTTTVAARPPLQLIGPGEQSENEEEDEDDLELESDEDHSKLRIAGALPGTEEGSPAARGDDGTINPPFP